ncbi:MAG: ABC-type transport auxiliary lipoprotein family protein [Nitrospirae bacterium]|nr:ABC-type transport auxiliary lipoprotein family protein [Nitrospirota bacterium]
MPKRMIVCLLAVFLASCAMPETRIYSLSVPDGNGAANPKSDAELTIFVNAPRYLMQPYIAFRNSPYQLTISRYAKWDAAPEQILKETFRDSFSSSGAFRDVRVSHLVPGGSYSLRIDLKRFERLDNGDLSYGELAFDVDLISPDGKSVYEKAFSKKVKLEDRTFLSLAKGLSDALAEGVREVGDGVGRSVR